MKKFLSIALTALMVAAMAIPTFAAYTAETDLGNVKFDVKKISAEWKADGVMSEGEYYPIEIKDTWISAATATDAEMDYALKLRPTFGMSWDENYVYTYSQYDVKEFNNPFEGNEGNMWLGTAVQLNFADKDNTAGDRLEYGVAIDSASKKNISTVWSDYLGTYAEVPAADYNVTINGKTITYEVRTPITAFSANAAAKLGDTYGYCIVWAGGYVEGEHLHTQLASGCTGDSGKAAENFAKISLVAAPEKPVVEVPAEVPATDAATDAPTTAAQTSDATVLFALLAVAALGTAVVVTKKVRA